MKKKLFVAGISILICSLSPAQSIDDTNISVAKPVLRSGRISSQENRQNKNFSVFISPFGIGFGGIKGSAGASLYLNPRTVLSFEAIRITDFSLATKDNDTGEYKKINDDVNGSGLALSLKYFTGNSFYVKPFLFTRELQIKERNTFFIFGGSGEVLHEGRLRDSGLGLSLGNEWQWNKFSLGVDWVTASWALKREASGDLSDEKVGLLAATSIYLGLSF